MFLGLVSPAVVAVVTVFTSKNKALINDFKKKLIGFYRIKPKYILIAVLIFAVIVTASIGTSVLFGGSINQFSFTEDFSFSIGGRSASRALLLYSNFLLQQFFVYSLIHFQKEIITTAIYYNSILSITSPT